MQKKIITELKELEINLANLYKERFKILIEKTNGTQFKKRHIIKKIKRDIAKTLTLISEIKKSKK